MAAERPKLTELADWSNIHVISENVETPGSQSIGQQSSVSGYSVSSRCQFLKGKTEKDAYVEAKVQTMREDKKRGNPDDQECGLGQCRPSCLQYFANIKSFVVCMSLLLATSGTMSTGYFNSVITTIEKRFEIGSSVSGLIAASYEFGSLVTVIFISYLGGRRHIPRWIGYGIIFMGFGALLIVLPHILAEKYTVNQGIMSNETEENICKTDDKSGPFGDKCISEGSGNVGNVLILIFAQVLIGTGGTPILTLGTTYVDDHVSKDKAPVYLAFIYASGVLGPVLGYALGALLLQYYVDMFIYEVDIMPGDPQWIGAWWGGFIICGGIFFTLSIPFMAFPKVLVKEKRKLLELKAKEDLLSQDDLQSRHSDDYGKTIKDCNNHQYEYIGKGAAYEVKHIPRSILNLLTNKIYLITCLGICCEISIVSGFVVFLPKYLETQFGTSKSVANLFTGGIGIPGAVVGILVGGFILKRFQLRPKGAVQLALVLDILAFIGFISFFVLGCENLKIAGATYPYSAYFNSSEMEQINVETNLTSSCNMDCACSNNDLEPICGINGITYFSPCHAGCTRFYSYITPEEKLMNFSGCSCIMDNISISPEVIMSPVATKGPCKSTCQNLFPFLILLVGVTFTVAGTQMPLLMVTLRSVHEEERCFALGMQFVILRLFAYIPSPIMFGNTIDTACLLWKERCGHHGSCLVYDIVQFRYKYVGISAGLKLLGATLFLIVWFLIKKRNEQDMQNTLSVGEIMNSVNSINKMDMDYDQRSKHRRTSSQSSSHDNDHRRTSSLKRGSHDNLHRGGHRRTHSQTSSRYDNGLPTHTQVTVDHCSNVYTHDHNHYSDSDSDTPESSFTLTRPFESTV